MFKYHVIQFKCHVIIINVVIILTLFWRGEFGEFYDCQEVTTDRKFVAKVVTTETAEQKARAIQEFEMHRQLSHPRIAKLEDAFSSEQQFLLVMEQ